MQNLPGCKCAQVHGRVNKGVHQGAGPPTSTYMPCAGTPAPQTANGHTCPISPKTVKLARHCTMCRHRPALARNAHRHSHLQMYKDRICKHVYMQISPACKHVQVQICNCESTLACKTRQGPSVHRCNNVPTRACTKVSAHQLQTYNVRARQHIKSKMDTHAQ